MVQNYHKEIFFLGLLIISTIAIFQFNISFNWTTCISVLTFTSFASVIYNSLNYRDDYYSSNRLFFTVTIYSCVIVALFWCLSWFIDGDIYIFSKADALLYERESMKLKELSYANVFSYLKYNYHFDDWGAFIMICSILKFIPHKIFLNFCYIIMGGITSVAVFKTGCRIMSKQHAYLAALAFSISSYNIFFYGSYLKETGFILLIALLFNSLYKCIIDKKNSSILFVIFYSLLICFFRPATTVFIWFSIFFYFLFRTGNSFGKIVIISIIGIVTLYTISSLENIYNRYTFGGNIEYLLETKESTGLSKNVTYIINYFASLFGPFPTLISTKSPLISLYGPGLLYKFFMNLPFWLAAWKIMRDRIVNLYPMLFFIIIEALSTAFVQKGFELRLTLPHIAMYYLIAFWYFSEIDSDEEEKFYKYTSPFFIITFLVICGWGILRT